MNVRCVVSLDVRFFVPPDIGSPNIINRLGTVCRKCQAFYERSTAGRIWVE
jgi:hypothetical protein